MTAPLHVDEIRKDFPNLKARVRGKPLVYLDNAATTFKPQCVIDTLIRHYQSGTANVHRGVHFLSEQATEEFEQARAKVQRFLNAAKPSEIIFTRGATEAINLVAYSYGRTFLKKGDEILISEMEHHSNIVPWQILCQERECLLKVVPFNDQGELKVEELERRLTPQTKLVAMVYISNSLGTINPIKKIIETAHQFNIPVLVDGAQAVGHLPVDVQELDCDFLAFSGHKIFGPTGVGVLYGKERLLEKMPPFLGGGDMILSVTFKKTTFNQLPFKFEAGTPNIADVIALGSALDYIESIGRDRIAAYEQELLEYGREALSAIDGLRFIGTAKEKTAIFSFVLPGIHAHDLGTIVDAEGVAIRTGHHCTQPVMQHFGVPATSRASLAMYNTTEEIDVLGKAIRKAKEKFQ